MSVQTVNVRLADGSVQRLTQAQLQEQINQGKITADAARPYLLQFEDQKVGDNVQFSDGAKDKPPVDEKAGNPGADAAAQNVAGTKALSDAITKAQEGDPTAIIDLAKAGNKDAIDFCKQNGVKLDEAKPVSGRDYVVGVTPQKIYDLFDAVDGTKEGVTPQQKQEALDELYSLMPNSISKEPTANGTSFYDYAVYLLQTNGYEDKDKKIPEMQQAQGLTFNQVTEAKNAEDKAEAKAQKTVSNPSADARDRMEEHMESMSNENVVKGNFPRISKADYEAAKKEYEEAVKAQERYRAQQHQVTGRKLDDATRRTMRENDRFYEDKVAKAKEKFDHVKYYYEASMGKIAKINRNTLKDYKNVDKEREANHLYASKDEANASGDKSARSLSEEQLGGLHRMSNNVQNAFEDLQAEYDKKIAAGADPNSRDMQILARRLELAEDTKAQALKIQESLESGKVDIAALQDFIAEYTGADDRLNLDEVDDLATVLGVSKGEAKDLAKKAGFGIENGRGQRWRNALFAFGTALAGNLLGGLLHDLFRGTSVGADAVATAVASVTATATAKVWVPGTGHYIQVDDGQGGTISQWVQDTEGHWAEKTTTETNTVTNTVTEPGKKVKAPSAFSGMGLPSMLIGPLLAGVTAYALTKPKTEEAFNTGEIDAVLNDAAQCNGTKESKALVQAIIDLDLSKIDPNPVVQKAIKAAVLENAIGKETGIANEREINAAYTLLKMAADDPNLIKGLADDQTDITPTQVQKPDRPEPINPPPKTDDDDDNPDVHAPIHEDVIDKTNYFFDVRGCGAGQYVAAVYPDFNKLSKADRQKVIDAFKEANPGIWGHDYYYGRQYDKPDGSGKFDKKGLPVYFPDVDLGDGRTLKPDLSKKPKPGRIAPGKGGGAPKANPNNQTDKIYGEGAKHADGQYHNKDRDNVQRQADENAKKKPQNQ